MGTATHGREPLQLRALYTVGELAGAVGVTPYMMSKLLRAKGVELLQSRRRRLVPLCEIEEKLPSCGGASCCPRPRDRRFERS